VWLEIAREEYASLPAETRGQVDVRIEQLLENPRQPRGGMTSSPTSGPPSTVTAPACSCTPSSPSINV